MQIHLIAVGQKMPGWVVQGYRTFAERLPWGRGYVLHYKAAPEGIADWLGSRGVTPTCLLLTHLHYDHIGNADLVPNATFHCHPEELASFRRDPAGSRSSG